MSLVQLQPDPGLSQCVVARAFITP